MSKLNQNLKHLKNGPEKAFQDVITSGIAYPLVRKAHDLAKAVFQRDAIILLLIWAKQRHFEKRYYTFDGNLITFYVCYLQQ